MAHRARNERARASDPGELHGASELLKLLVFKPAGACGYFKFLGLPGWLAYVTMVAELAGPAALVMATNADPR